MGEYVFEADFFLRSQIFTFCLCVTEKKQRHDFADHNRWRRNLRQMK